MLMRYSYYLKNPSNNLCTVLDISSLLFTLLYRNMYAVTRLLADFCPDLLTQTYDVAHRTVSVLNTHINNAPVIRFTVKLCVDFHLLAFASFAGRTHQYHGLYVGCPLDRCILGMLYFP